MKVAPLYLQANGLWNIFTGRKKYRITCGKCDHTYDDKVPFREDVKEDRASSVCPNCGSQNVWDHNKFNAQYNEWTERVKQRK